MSHKIRLGPIAVFLAVVAVVLTTLAILTTATSNADRVMAERFGQVTQVRYELEAEGQKYLTEVDKAVEDDRAVASYLNAKKLKDGSFSREIIKGGYKLTIVITDPADSGSYEIKEWKITKEWNAEDPFKNVWQGN